MKTEMIIPKFSLAQPTRWIGLSEDDGKTERAKGAHDERLRR